MTAINDRRVHAANHHTEVVRYDRAGKWYIEPRDRSLPRQRVTVGDAVRHALWLYEHDGGMLKQGVPGGGTFDRLVHSGSHPEQGTTR